MDVVLGVFEMHAEPSVVMAALVAAVVVVVALAVERLLVGWGS